MILCTYKLFTSITSWNITGYIEPLNLFELLHCISQNGYAIHLLTDITFFITHFYIP